MSFIIKKFLRRLIEQYLNIHDQINLDKGELQLPSGHLNQNNINKILKQKNVAAEVLYSHYTGLSLSLPIIQILSKPIVLKMQNLRIVMLVDSNFSNPKMSQPQKQEQKSKQQIRQTEKNAKIMPQQISPKKKQQQERQQDQTSTKNQKSYLKSIINRLLTNMQVQIKNFEVIVRFGNQVQIQNQSVKKERKNDSVFKQIDDHEYKITLENFVAKNSLSLLQANILKKIVCMSRFGITVNKFEKENEDHKVQGIETKTKMSTIAEILDLNMSLNIDYTRVTMICLLDRLVVAIETNLIKWIIQKLKGKISEQKTKPSSKQKIPSDKNIQKQKQNVIKNSQKAGSEIKDSFQPDLQAIQLKINEIRISVVDSDQVFLKNTKNPQICSLNINKLQITKQKLKVLSVSFPNSKSNQMLHEGNPTNLKSSHYVLQLQSIIFSSTNRSNDTNENIFILRMCQRRNKVQNSTIQNWNKKKRKQFQISVTRFLKNTKKIDIHDFEAQFVITKNLLSQIGKLVQFCSEVTAGLIQAGMKVGRAQRKNQKNVKIGEEERIQKNENSLKIPQIKFSNTKVQLKLETQMPWQQNSILLNAHVAQTIKFSQIGTQTLEKRNKNQYLLQISQLVASTIIFESKCEILNVKDIKVKYAKQMKNQVNDSNKNSQEITVSVHGVSSNVDTKVVQKIGQFFRKQQHHSFVVLGKLIQTKVNGLIKIFNIKKEGDMKKQQIESKEELKEILMQQTQIKKQPQIGQEKEKEPQDVKSSISLYIRISNLTLCIGSTPLRSKLFSPVFIIQLCSIKVLSLEYKKNIKFTLKSICAISPHNLSNSVLLKAPVKIKLYQFQSTKYQKPEKRQSSGQASCGITILDPLFLQIHQQHLLLLSTILKSCQSPTNTYFTKLKNTTKSKIKYKLNQQQSEKLIIQKQDGKYMKNDEQQNQCIYGNFNVEYEILPNCEEQVYLFQVTVRVQINGEISQSVEVGVGDLVDSVRLARLEQELFQEDKANTKLKVQKSTSLTVQTENQHHVKQQKSLPSSDKSLPASNSPSSIPSPTSSPIIQKPLIFPYHDDCKYYLEIGYTKGHLQLNVKYKYQLHLFEGIKGGCRFDMLQIRAIKFDCYQRYDVKSGKQRKQLQKVGESEKSQVVSLDWELLEEDRIQHTSFIIQRQQHLQQYKLCRLMTNTIKYKLFGLYPEHNRTNTSQISQSQTSQLQHARPCDYYILQPLNSQSSLSQTTSSQSINHNYYLMPFLVLINNLQNHSIRLKISSKKSQICEEYTLASKTVCSPVNSTFDYYMKQFMIQLYLEDKYTQLKDNETFNIKYESQEHYFNTFFMVSDSFQNIIQLRSQHSSTKRYVRIRESFVYKTKILEIQDCMHVDNLTQHPLELVIIPGNTTRFFGTSKSIADNNGKYILKGQDSLLVPNKIKKDDILRISYLYRGKKQNSIQVPLAKIIENDNKILLSFNFCPVNQHNNKVFSQQNNENEQYYQILIKLQIKSISHSSQNLSYNSSNLQIRLIFSDFIIFHNFCTKQRVIRLNKKQIKSSYSQPNARNYKTLLLPSNTNKDYNNKYLGINCQQIYEDLLINSKNWIMEGNSGQMQIQLVGLSTEDSGSFKDKQVPVLYLNELITHKIIQHNRSVYSLLKSFKDQKIQLFFGDSLFSNSTPLKYFIFNNRSNQYFLMNYSQTEYAKYLLFPNKVDKQAQNQNEKRKKYKKQKKPQKQSQMGQPQTMLKKPNKVLQAQTQTIQHQSNKVQKIQQSIESPQKVGNSPYFSQFKKQSQIFNNFTGSKVFIEGKSKSPLSIMLNKDKHDIFLCDSEFRKLEPLTLRKLQKLRIKHEKYQIQNFTVFDLQNQNIAQSIQATQSPQLQFITSLISLKLISKTKNLSLSTDIKNVSIRCFENDKVDILVQDVCVNVSVSAEANADKQRERVMSPGKNMKSKTQNHQILRIAQQTYLLIEGKIFQQKLVLVKNLYVKCKIIDLHVNKQLLSVTTHFGKIFKYISQYLKPDKTHQPNSLPSGSQCDKILTLSKQKLLLIRSTCIHPINLHLTVQTNPTLDISNMITLPELTISNKVYRMSSWVKQMSNHYLTNIIAKFPKLSFIYQNLRSPVSMVKAILETRNIIAGGDWHIEKYRIAMMCAYVQLERAFHMPATTKSFEKRLLALIGPNNKKSDTQLQKVNTFLLQLCLSTRKQNSQQFVCPLKNIVSSNITKLSQMSNIVVCYYLTNKNIKVICSNFPSQSISLKEIQYIKITKYNKKNAQFYIGFRRRGVFLKIVDTLEACHYLAGCFNTVLL